MELIDRPFLEEGQITICDNSKLCIELGKQIVGVVLQKDSRLRFYRYKRRHEGLRVKVLWRADPPWPKVKPLCNLNPRILLMWSRASFDNLIRRGFRWLRVEPDRDHDSTRHIFSVVISPNAKTNPRSNQTVKHASALRALRAIVTTARRNQTLLYIDILYDVTMTM